MHLWSYRFLFYNYENGSCEIWDELQTLKFELARFFRSMLTYLKLSKHASKKVRKLAFNKANGLAVQSLNFKHIGI